MKSPKTDIRNPRSELLPLASCGENANAAAGNRFQAIGRRLCLLITAGIPFTPSRRDFGGGVLSYYRLPTFAYSGVLVLLLFLVPPSLAPAANIPSAINYQGKLTTSSGQPVTNGLYQVEFRIWDTPTSTNDAGYIWGRSFPLYVASNGMFNVLLSDDGGDLNWPTSPPKANYLAQAFDASDRYLGLTITGFPPTQAPAGTGEISPRQRLVSAPYAVTALQASKADTAAFATNAFSAKSVTDSATLSGGLTVAGPATFSGQATFAGATTLSGQVSVTGSVSIKTNLITTGGGFVPVGAILMWSGTTNTIPPGWALCDGGNSTPDLRGRFVLGMSPAYPWKATGGKETHVLAVSEMPSHSHPVTVKTVGYNATYKKTKEATGAPDNDENQGSENFPASTTGGGAAHTNMPPYYALAFIMRTQ